MPGIPMMSADDADKRVMALKRGRHARKSSVQRRAQSVKAGKKRPKGKLKTATSEPALTATIQESADLDTLSPLNVAVAGRRKGSSLRDYHAATVRDLRTLSIHSVASDDEDDDFDSSAGNLAPPRLGPMGTKGQRGLSNESTSSSMSISSSLGFTTADTLRMLVNAPLNGRGSASALMTTEERVRVLEQLHRNNALFLHEPDSKQTEVTTPVKVAERYRGSVTQEDLFNEELDTPSATTPVRSRRSSKHSSPTGTPAHKRSHSAGAKGGHKRNRSTGAAVGQSKGSPPVKSGSKLNLKPPGKPKTPAKSTAKKTVVVSIGSNGTAATSIRKAPRVPSPIPQPPPYPSSKYQDYHESPSEEFYSDGRRLSTASTTLEELVSTQGSLPDMDVVRFIAGSTDDDAFLGGGGGGGGGSVGTTAVGAGISAPTVTVYDQMIVFSQTHKELQREVTERRQSIANQKQKSTTERVLSSVLGDNMAAKLVNFFSRS